MKNKLKKILILFVIVVIGCIVDVNVYAETMNSNIPETYEIKKEDVPTSTYIIGTHMFTREKNEEIGYDGQLSTQLIMLASQTINSDNLADMIIYYKNPRGKWVNALTENNVSAPTTFEISKKDLEKYVLTPVLQFNTYIHTSFSPNQMQDVYINVKNYEDYYSESNEHTYNISGIEFSRTWIGGDGVKRYGVIDNMNPDSFYSMTNSISGIDESYVARAYIIDAQGNKIYSDYSNEIEIDLYKNHDGNEMSLDEFKEINSETTLGELKSKYNLEPSIANLANDTTTYLYDFKGHVNNSAGITPNVQFEFGSDVDSAKVKAKVYRNLVTDDEIDHSKYDDGDGIIEIDDFESIKLATLEELEELVGEPYMIKAIYDREGSGGIPTIEYPTIEYTYRIKDSDQIINFAFANSGKFISLTTALEASYAKNLLNKIYVSDDSNFELEFTNFDDFDKSVNFVISTKNNRLIQVYGEVRATTLEKLQPDYIFRGNVAGGVIIGRLRKSGLDKFIIDCYVFKDTKNSETLPEAFNDLNIGYNKIEFTLKSE